MEFTDEERKLLKDILNKSLERDGWNGGSELDDVSRIDEEINELQNRIDCLEERKQEYMDAYNKRKLTIRIITEILK